MELVVAADEQFALSCRTFRSSISKPKFFSAISTNHCFAPFHYINCTSSQDGEQQNREDVPKLAVLISGGGRSLENLIERIRAGTLSASIEVVISSRPDAYGLVRAQNASVPTHVFVRKEYPSTDAYSVAVSDCIRQYDVDLVVLAGFLVLYKASADLAGRVINIHPALIPKYCGKGFYGDRVHEAVLANHEQVSGCTVHIADDQYDNGPIILQKEVPVLPTDDPHALADRVFEAEKEALPEAIKILTPSLLSRPGRTSSSNS